jgi:hypothetical protein
MTGSCSPFSLPANLPPELVKVRNYWEHLKRGENAIPFSDDVALSSLPELRLRLFLLDVFADPPRCRFAQVGRMIAERYGAEIEGAFADEIRGRPPLNHVVAQFSATIEDSSPTFYRYGAGEGGADRSYARIMLPLWGNGRIDMILGAVA